MIRNETVELFLNKIHAIYTSPLIEYLKSNPDLQKTCPGLLVNFKEITFYFGKYHIGIEYDGPYEIAGLDIERDVEVNIVDFSFKECEILDKIIGYDFSDAKPYELPHHSENLIFPTNDGIQKLLDLKWNFLAQTGAFSLNGKPYVGKNKAVRIINTYFFDAKNDSLQTRHVKWLEIFPVISKSNAPGEDYACDLSILMNYIEHDANFSFNFPNDFRNKSLPIINRFIELWGNKDNPETVITRFLSLAENKFILKSKFGAKDIFPEKLCEWQTNDRKPIKPDFFILQPNGYADIVDFKLPDLSKVIVGKNNAKRFSAILNQYITQIGVYAEYFTELKNREWFENKYGFKVHHPRKYLIMGRRHNFQDEVWRDLLARQKDIDIYTYDDLIDCATAQFYTEN